MVFQSYALYPHMTVRRNIEFPLAVAAGRRGRARPPRRRGGRGPRPRRPARPQAGAALRRSAPARRPGPGDRAAAAGVPHGRAALEPRRQAAGADPGRAHRAPRRLATTIVYVTHDQVEAMTMGDRIAILERGRAPAGRPAPGGLRASGEPVRRPLHRQPAHEHGRPAASPSTTASAVRRRVAGGRIPLPRRAARAVDGGRARPRSCIGVRPEHLRSAPTAGSPATVRVIESLGHERHVVCRLDDGQLVIVRQARERRRRPRRGERGRASPPTRRASTSSTPRPGARIDDRDATTPWRPPALAPRPAVAAAPAPPARRGLAYLLLLPSLVIFGVFIFYPFLRELLPGLLPHAAVPRAAEAATSASTSTATC